MLAFNYDITLFNLVQKALHSIVT